MVIAAAARARGGLVAWLWRASDAPAAKANRRQGRRSTRQAKACPTLFMKDRPSLASHHKTSLTPGVRALRRPPPGCDASSSDGRGLKRWCLQARMTEAAQERSGSGTAAQMGAHHANHPSGSLKPSPIPVIAKEIVSGAEDLAPRKDRQFASVGRYGRAIHRFGGKAWRAALIQLDHREPGIGGHHVPRAVLRDPRNVRAPDPVKRIRATRECQIIGDLVAFLVHVGGDLMGERFAWPEEPEIHVARGGTDPQFLAVPIARLLPQADMVTLGNVVESFFPGHV